MKILELNAAYHHGGASIHAMDICKGLAKLGHDVVYCTIGPRGQKYQQDGYRVETLQQTKKTAIYHYFNPYILYKLKNILFRHQPDIIHLHNINLQSFSLAILFYSKIYPIVWTLHDVWPICMIGWPEPNTCAKFKQKCAECPNWPQSIVIANRFLKEAAYKLNDFVITCPSSWMCNNLIESSLSKKTIEHIPLAIDEDLFKRHNDKEIHLNYAVPGKKTILFSGGKRLAGSLPAWRKGWSIFCETLRQLEDIKDEIHLLYVGDEIELPDDIKVSATFVENISRKEMLPLYRSADLFVLPSMADNSPLTILEAMYCRTPVIASKVGGIPELVEHGKTGLLCSPTDSEAFADAVRYMIGHPGEAKQMAQAGYEKSERHQSYRKMLTRYENLFKRIAEKRS
ncbi:MAG: glycosyltransferase [Desulfobacterales bacterium]|nr:glycosyltransferase [Desulfobacterales bacterium]